jgi:hypothetical protein
MKQRHIYLIIILILILTAFVGVGYARVIDEVGRVESVEREAASGRNLDYAPAATPSATPAPLPPFTPAPYPGPTAEPPPADPYPAPCPFWTKEECLGDE